MHEKPRYRSEGPAPLLDPLNPLCSVCVQGQPIHWSEQTQLLWSWGCPGASECICLLLWLKDLNWHINVKGFYVSNNCQCYLQTCITVWKTLGGGMVQIFRDLFTYIQTVRGNYTPLYLFRVCHQHCSVLPNTHTYQLKVYTLWKG